VRALRARRASPCIEHGYRKALKVAELKELLTQAGEKPAAKATKADLVAKVLATPAARDAFTQAHGGAQEAPVRALRIHHLSLC
jgi:hypothetical protein